MQPTLNRINSGVIRLARNQVDAVFSHLGYLLATAFVMIASAGASAGTAFTYQGELSENGEPADGALDIEFSLWDALVDGNQLCCPVAVNNVQVIDGRFTAQLDFGADAFDNTGRWLQLIVNGFVLSPRQPITRTPYSIQTRGIFVDEDQNVGIGTNTPNAKLDVKGLAAFENTVFSEQATFGGGARLQGGGLIVDGPSLGGPTDHSVSIYANTEGDALRSINDGSGKAGRFHGNVIMTGGNTGINTLAPDASLAVVGNGSEPVIHAEAAGTGPGLRIGQGPDTLDVDVNSINIRGDSPLADPLYLNNDVAQPVLIGIGGGNLGVGGGTAGFPVVKLHVDGGTNVSDGDPTSGFVLVGSPVGYNLVMDPNQITARNGGAASTLYLNGPGSDVVVGGTLDIGWEIREEKNQSTVYCSAGKRPLGGGCLDVHLSSALRLSAPFCDENGCGWFCDVEDDDEIVIISVVCANVK